MASSLGGITVTGRERSFVLKQGRARGRARQDPTEQSTRRAGTPNSNKDVLALFPWPGHMLFPRVGERSPYPTPKVDVYSNPLPPPPGCALLGVRDVLLTMVTAVLNTSGPHGVGRMSECTRGFLCPTSLPAHAAGPLALCTPSIFPSQLKCHILARARPASQTRLVPQIDSLETPCTVP